MKPAIKKTENYKLFKYVLGNRPVDYKHINHFLKSIPESDLTAYAPIIVNENMEIIDGQHRFRACEILRKPIYYVIAKGMKLKDVVNINKTQKNWQMEDYLNSHLKFGVNPAYGVIKDFAMKYKMPLGLSVFLLIDQKKNGAKGSTDRTKFKDGSVVLGNVREADFIVGIAKQIAPFSDPLIIKDRNFYRALRQAVRTKGFDVIKFIAKLKGHNIVLHREASTLGYLRELEDLYNISARKRLLLSDKRL